MRWLVLIGVACGCGGEAGESDAPGVDGVVADGAAIDGDLPDGVAIDGPPIDGAGIDSPIPTTPKLLFQCHGTNGGICAMNADGSDRATLNGTGFVPHDAGGGAVLFHTAAYRVARWNPDGSVDDLTEGAFARRLADGRILFQCTGLGGGICTLSSGGQRDQLRATGRVPDGDASGRIVFHSDGYRVIRRDAGGAESDLGDGAFATWTADGRILFQCSGLGGGLCRMNADGSGRETLSGSGRVPEAEGDRIVFHSDGYQIMMRSPSGTESRGNGANASWR